MAPLRAATSVGSTNNAPPPEISGSELVVEDMNPGDNKFTEILGSALWPDVGADQVSSLSLEYSR